MWQLTKSSHEVHECVSLSHRLSVTNVADSTSIQTQILDKNIGQKKEIVSDKLEMPGPRLPTINVPAVGHF